MTIKARASIEVLADPEDVLRFVIDLDRYRVVDPKILKVWGVTGPDTAGIGSLSLLARVKGMPPAPDKHDFMLERWSSVRFTGASRQPARLIYDFVGVVECEPRAAGRCHVTHHYDFAFKGPFTLAERYLGSWLQQQVTEEVADLARYFAPGTD